jgi:arylmalonate decarboxylase
MAAKIGNIGPISKAFTEARDNQSDPNLRPEKLLPDDVVFIESGFELTDYTPEGDEEGAARYFDRVDEVAAQKVDRIGWQGLPISAQLGRERSLKMIAETAKRTGVPAGSDAEDVIEAFKHMGVKTIAIASRWATPLNKRLVEYFEHGGLKVASITTEGQMGAQAFNMSLDQGIKLAFQLSRRAMKEAPKAEGLLVAGGTWRSLGCLPPLEDEFGIPVVSNPSASIWRVMHEGWAPPVKGWTRLLEHPR